MNTTQEERMENFRRIVADMQREQAERDAKWAAMPWVLKARTKVSRWYWMWRGRIGDAWDCLTGRDSL